MRRLTLAAALSALALSLPAEAGAVAARLGIPHVILDQAETMFEATQRAIARQNLCSVEHAWILPLVDYVRGQFGVVYDGIGGDVLSAGLLLAGSRTPRSRTQLPARTPDVQPSQSP